MITWKSSTRVIVSSAFSVRIVRRETCASRRRGSAARVTARPRKVRLRDYGRVSVTRRHDLACTVVILCALYAERESHECTACKSRIAENRFETVRTDLRVDIAARKRSPYVFFTRFNLHKSVAAEVGVTKLFPRVTLLIIKREVEQPTRVGFPSSRKKTQQIKRVKKRRGDDVIDYYFSRLNCPANSIHIYLPRQGTLMILHFKPVQSLTP